MDNATVNKTAYSMNCAMSIALSAAVQAVFSGFGTNCALYFSMFICTVCCPLRYGVFCAFICPAIAMMSVSSPAAVLLPAGIAKCLAFVLISRLLLSKVKTGMFLSDLYLGIIPAVCIGQMLGGAVCGAVFCGDMKSLVMFIAAELIAALPELLFLLAILPGTVFLLSTLGAVDGKLISAASQTTEKMKKSENSE